MKPVSLIASIILFVIAIGHLLRIIFQVEITIGCTTIPMWQSIFGFIFLGVIAVLLWRESRK